MVTDPRLPNVPVVGQPVASPDAAAALRGAEIRAVFPDGEIAIEGLGRSNAFSGR